MKRNLMLIIALVLAMSLLAGCAGTVVVVGDCTCPTGSHTPETQPSETKPDDNTDIAEGKVKTGLAVFTTINKSTSATADAEGAVSYDVTIAAVTVDDNGVITDCVLDSIGATVKLSNTGAITSDVTAAVATKNELGENYGMVAWGGAIAEWNEQAAALCDFAIGKTVQELREGAVDETGYAPAGSDLATSATIYLAGYVDAIEAAVINAAHLGASAGDELKLSTVNSLASSTAPTADKAGNAQLDATVSAVTVKDGIITSCLIDSVQAKVAFDTTGTITTDLNAPFPTKNDLGADYGMVAWGGAIAEWNEQAAAFASYVTGKTAAEVAGISVNEGGAPADADLATSVTIKIGDFQALIAKAFAE